MRLSD